MSTSLILILLLGVASVSTSVFFYLQNRLLRTELRTQTKKEAGESAKREQETNRRMYELGILQELSERIGYSLNIKNIAEVITGSLHQFIDYSAAAYMLLEPEKILFRIHLERSVSRKFLNEVQARMLASMSAILDRDLKNEKIEEVLSGAILLEEVETTINSFFNIPLVIGKKVVGVLTIAHTMAGLYKEEEMTILYKIIGRASQAVARLQEVVQIEQEKMSSMIETIVDGVIMTDKDYRLIVANPAAKQIINLINKPEVTIFDFIDRLAGKLDIREKLEESLKLDKILGLDNILINDHYFKVFVAPVKSHYGTTQGEILGGVVIFHDITHEKEVDKVKTEFVSLASHQLRSPLSAINWNTEMLLGGSAGPINENQKKYLGAIYQGSMRMVDLINALLDVSRLELGTFVFEPVPTDIVALAQSVIEEQKSELDARKQTLTSKFDIDIPIIPIDPKLIRIVLQNFLSNAVKYTPEAGKIEFSLSLDKEKNYVLLKVSDNGYGIPKNQQDKIFSKLFRADNAKKADTQGTGLGLYIVKSVIERSGGKVWFESEQDKGTTFYATLPLIAPVETVIPAI